METVNEDERALALNEVQILKVGHIIGLYQRSPYKMTHITWAI